MHFLYFPLQFWILWKGMLLPQRESRGIREGTARDAGQDCVCLNKLSTSDP